MTLFQGPDRSALRFLKLFWRLFMNKIQLLDNSHDPRLLLDPLQQALGQAGTRYVRSEPGEIVIEFQVRG